MANRPPVNLTILKPTKDLLQTLRPVRVSDIFDGMSTNFHEDGLFSVSTFGRVGSDERDKRFGFIDIKVPVFHPLLYKRLMSLKALYGTIISGKSFARWDPIANDLVLARVDDEGAGTGFGFFVQHWDKIRFHTTESLQRQMKIALLNKYKDKALTDKILVLPAGLRDIEIDAEGRKVEDELNSPYRRLIAVANTIPDAGNDFNAPYLDSSRRSLQTSFGLIYEMINQILYGKKGFIQAKWASRRIFNGTRNVISTMETASAVFDGPRSVDLQDTQIGLLQTMKSALPVAVHCLMTGWLSHVFGSADQSAVLVNPKTWHAEYVDVDVDVIDRWTTAEGLEKAIERFSETKIRNRPLRVENHYIGLVYADEKYFKIFNDIDQLPKHLSRKNVHPMTMTELMYLSGYRRWYELYTFGTRFPVAELGSMYPSKVYTRTTILASAKEELGEDWQPKGEGFIAREFPAHELTAPFMDSQAPHPSNLKNLQGDHDGDTMSCDTVYITESVEEVKKYLGSLASIMTPAGKLYTPANTDTIELVLRNLLRAPK